MYRFLMAIGIAAVLIAGPAGAAAQTPKAEVAENKAKTLERLASSEGNRESASPGIITRTEVQAVDPAGKEPLDDAITCLARTIYWEAKGENAAGMEAIASVVMNRLGNEGFPDTICGVVRQGREKGECQFSWWCDGRPDDVEEEGRYAAAKEIARKALNRQLEDRTHGALYFHQRKVSPEWAGKYTRTAEVGDHLFYKPQNNKAK